MAGVLRERDGSVGILTLDEPASLNAMTPELLGDLALAIGELSVDAELRALVLTGAGRGFCSGQNLKAFNSLGDDIVVFKDAARNTELTRLHTLRQQIARDHKGPGGRERANTALADFIAPRETGLADHIGTFAVTTGIGEEAALARYFKATDDYGRIMMKALADRLAEAFAEHLHARVRREFWGYASGETLSNDDLIAEKYQGIRPAPGYPAQPDHTEKATLWSLMDVDAAAGIKLTENYAMWPGSAVSGFYFAHPASHYFGVGKVERDQVDDYARRKGWDTATCERWLAPVLNYDRKATTPKDEAA